MQAVAAQDGNRSRLATAILAAKNPKMNPFIKQMWVRRIRTSNDFKPENTYLHTTKHGFSVLGLLVDEYYRSRVNQSAEWTYGFDESIPTFVWAFNEETVWLPQAVIQWAGLKSCCPSLEWAPDFEDGVAICDLGPAHQYTAEQIAQTIESFL